MGCTETPGIASRPHRLQQGDICERGGLGAGDGCSQGEHEHLRVYAHCLLHVCNVPAPISPVHLLHPHASFFGRGPQHVVLNGGLHALRCADEVGQRGIFLVQGLVGR